MVRAQEATLAAAILFAAIGPAHAASTETSGCTPIKTAAQLQAMKNNLAGTYCLMKDIDAGSIANFTPVGTDTVTPFTGRLYGHGHVIRDLKIVNTTAGYVGLFGYVSGGLIEDVGIINVNISAAAGFDVGALAGVADSSSIQHVYSTGRVKCSGPGCAGGGLFGLTQTTEILNSWSSAATIAPSQAGGLIGSSNGNTIVENSYATGDVTCLGSPCFSAGGLTGQFANGDKVSDSFAAGTARCDGCALGGFAGVLLATAVATNVYATGAVVGGDGSSVGGLAGRFSSTAQSCFAAGPVHGGTGAMVGGLFGDAFGTPTLTNCYWDNRTTGQATSSGGLGTARTTVQLRNNLPAGLAPPAWQQTKTLSYPILGTDGFSSNLATLVRANKIYTALPIMQADKSQYTGNPVHTAEASLATVYTMAARAVGETLHVAALDNVKINTYFWHDASQTTTFTGPVTAHATLGAMTPIAAATPLSPANVIGGLNAQNWVVLRGTYNKAGGGTATHYMLATLYTKKGTSLDLVIANDPFTGDQVAIDPSTKEVVLPQDFPLTGFKVNGYAAISNIH